MEALNNEAQDSVMTVAGRERLAAELDKLRQVRRPELVERLRVAREAGGWNNPEFLAARDELAFLDGRITTLERLLARAEVVEPSTVRHPKRVEVGTAATIRDESGAEERYTIVGPAEADPRRGRISYESPVGRALVGHGTGETVEVRAPAGARRLTILQIQSNEAQAA
jgi:transcription elongation factor GreA